MLRYMDDPQMLRSTGYKNQVVTKIIIKETDVHHSGSYQCEPGASPPAQVNVHVLDGKLIQYFVTLCNVFKEMKK